MEHNQNSITDISSLDRQFSSEVASLPGAANIKKCFACGTCAAGCPVTAVHPEYNCRTIIREVLMGMREKVLKSRELWYCQTCYRCSSRCPQQVNFADVMRALRYLAVKNGYAPASIQNRLDNLETNSQTGRSSRIAESLKELQV